MRIKQIELNGFKSFMERTVLEFPPGVTAVVGPNGCGKSNIVDAIRWVLGEQSPKHLRGAAMEDVVFGGNADQGPLGMAEVSLLLERDEAEFADPPGDVVDDDGIGQGLPPELANASEILVSRRYFRSGESEYFINRSPCRLRDITELFLGTGVGTKAYAIIEQGRVDQLVNAKPEELRLFLEEAAGTTRFRSRRLAAERKMERTRENLLRVQDVLHELERQRASLERQARRAEEYHRIKAELRHLDLRLMAGRQRTWTEEAVRLDERLVAVRREEAGLHETIRRSRGTTDEVRAARLATEERLREIEGAITEQRLAAGEAQARVDHMIARQRECATRASERTAEVERLRSRLAGLAAERDSIEDEVGRLAGELPGAEAERTALEARLEALRAAGGALERDLESAKDALLDAVAEEARLRNMTVALRQRREELEGRRRRIEDAHRVLGERLRANTHVGEELREATTRLQQEQAELEVTRTRHEERRQGLRRKESTQLERLETLRGETTGLRSRVDSLEVLQARHEGCTQGVASVLARGDGEAVLLARILRVPAPLERAAAAALGARLSHAVVPDTGAAVEAVRWLREAGGGSATVVPRDPDRRAPTIVPAGRRLVDAIEVDGRYWALAEALLGNVLVADDLDRARELWRTAIHPVTVVTLQGEAIDTLGAVSGGSAPPLEETILARARELRELKEALADNAARLVAEEAALSGMREALAESERELAAAEKRLQLVRVELVAAAKDREQLAAERERIAAELEVRALEAGGLEGEDGEMAGELAALAERERASGRTVRERREGLAQRQAALTAWHEEGAVAESARMEAAVRAAAIAERLSAARSRLGHWQASRREVEERAEVASAQAEEAGRGADVAASEAVTASAVRGEADRRVAALEEERGVLRAALADADAVLSTDDAAERTAREQLEAVREERSRIEVALAERRMAIENLAAQLVERYALGLDALAEVTLDDDGREDERAAQVETLRERLARLGDVNPAAVDELVALRGRHEFLSSQRADLEGSLDDLRRTIAKLTRASQQRFDDTFRAANEKLGEVFPKLFPGGTARLEARVPEDGDEPGIEIVVQPAGKKLQSLSLLSGGEKALTAVSLILSLFLIRPTPFCLLDEVDAPLDEANIGRFNQLVRELATASQFVLITHNRRTMEAADTLYGITMEQAGVSKIVSVRLREAA